MGIAALILGIIGLVLGIFTGWFGIIISILAVIFGAIGKAKHQKCAVGGLVCGIISLVFDFLWVFFIAALVVAAV